MVHIVESLQNCRQITGLVNLFLTVRMATVTQQIVHDNGVDGGEGEKKRDCELCIIFHKLALTLVNFIVSFIFETDKTEKQ